MMIVTSTMKWVKLLKGSFEVAENSCYGVTNTRVTGAIKGGESAYLFL